jgi:hypothetical protein
MVKHHKCFWRAVSDMSDKKWERVKFILKFSIWLLIIGLILVLIFLAPEQLESFDNSLSIIAPFAL